MVSALDFQSKDDGSIPFIRSNKIIYFIYSGLVKLESCRAHNPSLPFESAPATNKTQ